MIIKRIVDLATLLGPVIVLCFIFFVKYVTILKKYNILKKEYDSNYVESKKYMMYLKAKELLDLMKFQDEDKV